MIISCIDVGSVCDERTHQDTIISGSSIHQRRSIPLDFIGVVGIYSTIE